MVTPNNGCVVLKRKCKVQYSIITLLIHIYYFLLYRFLGDRLCISFVFKYPNATEWFKNLYTVKWHRDLRFCPQRVSQRSSIFSSPEQKEAVTGGSRCWKSWYSHWVALTSYWRTRRKPDASLTWLIGRCVVLLEPFPEMWQSACQD